MMRRYSLSPHRLLLAIAATLIASFAVATGAAQAVVINDINGNPSGTEAGVALTPSTRGIPLPGGVAAVPGAGCTDPWLSFDLGGPSMPDAGLCYRGGGVIHKNETFALTWDSPQTSPWVRHNYFSQTQGYVERFMRDVADASGSQGSPFAITPQYNDAGGRAQNASVFGGGCTDLGSAGGASCEFGGVNPTGHDFPASACPPNNGDSFIDTGYVLQNKTCLTDGQIQSELQAMIAQTGIIGRTQPGYTPLVSVLLPPGVVSCLDTLGTLCSVNNFPTPPPPELSTSTTGGSIPAGVYQVELTYDTAGGQSLPSASQWITTNGGTSTITIKSPPPAPAGLNVTGWYAYITYTNGFTFTRVQAAASTIGTDLTLSDLTTDVHGGAVPQQTAYCSYHSQVNVGGTDVAYVVQPWSAGTSCDEPGLPVIPPDPTPEVLDKAIGARLVSPLSQGEIGAIVNPGLNGWAGENGAEIMDNQGCTPLPRALDQVTVGSSSQNPYWLQREWNNGAALIADPNTYGCAPVAILTPDFVVPSSINEGDVVQFNGSDSATTLVIPNAGYAWDFGDGTRATGPSVVHSYSKGGTYNVTLTVTDRGSYTNTLTQKIQVLGSDGQPVPSTPTNTTPGAGGGGGGSGSGAGSAGAAVLNARLQLLPQSLKSVLKSGIAVRVSSNKAANGIATVWITRISAKKAHIKPGSGPAVRIGIGTVSSITNGSVTLRLHLSASMAKKLARLHHVAMTVRLSLVASGSTRLSIVAAGRY
jgi:PKD domain